MKDNEIMVSICCLVYNHEKYLRKCLDGFVMQKTNFKYEVLIHDDASTDHSADIIREYEKKYPDIIKPIYQTDNQYSKGVKISWTYQYPRAKGKYIALCEGDDYWTDELKLQKQFDVLELNTDCVFCTHIVSCISEDGRTLERRYPDIVNLPSKVNSRNWIQYSLSFHHFQTSSYFFRTDSVIKLQSNLPEFIKMAKVGDIPLMLLLAFDGECYFINEKMSCYRCGSIGSWTSRQKKMNLAVEHWKNWSKMLRQYNEYTNFVYNDIVQDAILQAEFNTHIVQNRFKNCFKKKYRSSFKQLNFKTKISVIIFAAFPSLRPLYLKIRYKYE